MNCTNVPFRLHIFQFQLHKKGTTAHYFKAWLVHCFVLIGVFLLLYSVQWQGACADWHQCYPLFAVLNLTTPTQKLENWCRPTNSPIILVGRKYVRQVKQYCCRNRPNKQKAEKPRNAPHHLKLCFAVNCRLWSITIVCEIVIIVVPACDSAVNEVGHSVSSTSVDWSVQSLFIILFIFV